MTAEIGDWLADLCSSDPAAATEVGATLVAVMSAEGARLPALVTDLGSPTSVDPDDLASDVDYAYQKLLEATQVMRREVAEAASTESTRLFRIEGAGQPPPEPEEVAFTNDEARSKARESALRESLAGYQHEIDMFRGAKEAAKARYTAAVAVRDIEAALLDIGPEPSGDQDAASAAVEAAEAELASLVARAQALRCKIVSGEHSSSEDAAETVPGLLELRVDPFGADIRVLSAFEPAGTLRLLAALEGAQAISEHRDQAIELAGDRLTEIRAASSQSETADMDEIEFADTTTFLDRFFAGGQNKISERSAVIASTVSAADLRRRAQRSRAEVAELTGLSETQVAALETGDLRSELLYELVAYVRALGGRLDLMVGSETAGPIRLV